MVKSILPPQCFTALFSYLTRSPDRFHMQCSYICLCLLKLVGLEGCVSVSDGTVGHPLENDGGTCTKRGKLSFVTRIVQCSLIIKKNQKRKHFNFFSLLGRTGEFPGVARIIPLLCWSVKSMSVECRLSCFYPCNTDSQGVLKATNFGSWFIRRKVRLINILKTLTI